MHIAQIHPIPQEVLLLQVITVCAINYTLYHGSTKEYNVYIIIPLGMEWSHQVHTWNGNSL